MQKWARYIGIGILPHNLHIERYHGVIKRKLKPFMRLDTFMSTLIKVNEKFHRKDICTALSIRGAFQKSAAQKKIAALHPSEENRLLIKEVDGQYKLSKNDEECETICTVFRNKLVCNRVTCKIICEDCPISHCLHEFVCTCDGFAFNNMCSHLHMVFQFLPNTDDTATTHILPPLEEQPTPGHSYGEIDADGV